METTQNIIILILLIITVWLYLDRKSLKYWRDYYLKESNRNIEENKEIFSAYLELETKLNKAEEIISQQKQELLTRKLSKKK